MKLRSIVTVLALLILSVFLIPEQARAAGLTFSPIEGPVGTEVTITSLGSYGTGLFKVTLDDSDTILAEGDTDTGVTDVTFTVPEATRGDHTVTLKIGENSFDREFKILPSLDLSSNEGTVGSSLTVSGMGFNQDETSIDLLFDDDAIEVGIQADGNGSWQSTLSIPFSTGGDHSIDARGTTPAEEVEDVLFNVLPKIEIDPTSGWVGAVVAISGTGFGESESNITITYDGVAAKTGVAADTKGSWQSTFSVPTSPRGTHTVSAYGSTTSESDLSEVSFSVSPVIRLEYASGVLGDAIHVGDHLVVSGIGFERNESSVSVTFDGVQVAGGIIADAKGSWIQEFSVPVTTNGKHSVDASGSSTKSSEIADVLVSISPFVEIDPTTGALGSEVALRGDGFAADKQITINFDGIIVQSSASSDAKGSFNTTFIVPKVQSGDHIITITDSAASIASVGFAIETTPPPIPSLISPDPNTRIGFFGGDVVTFNWSDVDDPSGVEYVLEVSQNDDFVGTIIRKEALAESEYALTEDEAVARGAYYWRVQAIDGAGNEGDWSASHFFRVGVMEAWHLVVAIVGVLVLAAIAWRAIKVSRQSRWTS